MLLVAGSPPWEPGFYPRSSHVGFAADKVALGQVFSKYVHRLHLPVFIPPTAPY
jgi:hypothetical protein